MSLHLRRLVALVLPLALSVPLATRAEPAEAWRSARWGMSPAELLKAFPGQAFALEPELKLADGTVVAAGIDGVTEEGIRLDARFLFSNGHLVLVSLRTPHGEPADAAVYGRMRAALETRWGAPAETSSDDEFVDVRETRWVLDSRRADLKFIPGVVVLLFHAR
jgi:hypothetical protein